MIKRLAVIIVGEYRTWPVVAEYFIKFFQDKAEQVDYFFSTWDVSKGQEVTSPMIQDYFHGYNLVNFKISKTIKEEYTFIKHAYLTKVGNIMKRQHELQNNFVYDQVVETRTDVYMTNTGMPWVIARDYEFSIGPIKQYQDEAGGKVNYLGGFLHIPDVYIRTNSFTNDILSNRYYRYKTKISTDLEYLSGAPFVNHHHHLVEYLYKHNMTSISHQRIDDTFLLDYRAIMVIREATPKPLPELTANDIRELVNSLKIAYTLPT